VRHHNDIARIEVEPAELPRVVEMRSRIIARFNNLGYKYVALDLAGFRSGSMNEGLSAPADAAGG
jgi:uncharacterized protein